ncbi:MAG TPA: hypothetical protein VFU46_07580, partial [Gemmatimonadales bacterium]|nr:hypothetical protein [Gemmatimonadales bacterium]
GRRSAHDAPASRWARSAPRGVGAIRRALAAVGLALAALVVVLVGRAAASPAASSPRRRATRSRSTAPPRRPASRPRSDARHYTRLTANVLRFNPTPETAAAPPRQHGMDERIGLGEYARSVRFYGQLVRNATRR